MKPSHHLAPWALMLSLLVIGCEDLLNPKSDDTPPTIELICNTHNGIAFFELQLEAEVNDNQAIKSVDFVVNDSIVHHATSPPWSATWAPDPTIIDTSYLVMAIAADQAGNITLSDILPVPFSRRTLDITRHGGSASDHWGWNFDADVKFGVLNLYNRYADPVSWNITHSNEIMLGLWPTHGTLQPGETKSVWVDSRRENYSMTGWHYSFAEIASDPGTSHTQKISLNVTELLPGSTRLFGSGNREEGRKLLSLDPDTVLVIGSSTGFIDTYNPYGLLVAFINADDLSFRSRWISFDQFEGFYEIWVRDAWLSADNDLIVAASIYYVGGTDQDFLACMTLSGELIWWQDIDGSILSADRRSDGLIAIAYSVDQSTRKILYVWENGSLFHEDAIPTGLGFDLRFYRNDQILISGFGALCCKSVETGATLWDFDDDGNYYFRGNYLIATDDLENIYLASWYWYDQDNFSLYKLTDNNVIWHTERSVMDERIRCIAPASDGSVFYGGMDEVSQYGVIFIFNADGSYRSTQRFYDTISGINHLAWSSYGPLLITGWSEDYLPSINNGSSDIIYHTFVPSEF